MTTHAFPTVIHLTTRLKRHTQFSAIDFNDVSGRGSSVPPPTPSDPYSSVTPSTIPSSSPAIPSSTPDSIQTTTPFVQSQSFSSSFTGSSSSSSLSRGTPVVLTSQVPITTITEPSTTITSFSQSLITSIPSASAFPAAQTIGSNLAVNPVCIGDGLDSSSIALLSTILVPSLIGLFLWVRPPYSFHVPTYAHFPSYCLLLLDLAIDKYMV